MSTYAPGNPRAHAELAMARLALGQSRAALMAAKAGLALVPRDADCLRVQAIALRDLGAPALLADAALAAYDRHKVPDRASELRERCLANDPRCAREGDPIHVHAMVPAARVAHR